MRNLTHTHTEKCQNVAINSFCADLTRRMEGDLETNYVARKSADATPGNFKERKSFENTQKTNEPILPETTPGFFANFGRAPPRPDPRKQNVMFIR